MKKLALATALALTLSTSAHAWYVTPFFDSYDTETNSNNDVTARTYGVDFGNELFSAGYKYKTIEIDHAEDIDDMQTLYGFVHTGFEVSQDVQAKVLAGGSFSWQEDFDAGDCYDVLAQGSLVFDLGNGFNFEGGAGVGTNPVKTYAYPVVQLATGDPKSEGLSFKVGFPTNEATFRFNDFFALNGKVSYLGGGYTKLKKHSVYGDESYLLDKAYRASIAAQFSPSEHTTINAGVAYTFDHYYKLYNKDGDYQGKMKLDSGAGVFVNGTAYF